MTWVPMTLALIVLACGYMGGVGGAGGPGGTGVGVGGSGSGAGGGGTVAGLMEQSFPGEPAPTRVAAGSGEPGSGECATSSDHRCRAAA